MNKKIVVLAIVIATVAIGVFAQTRSQTTLAQAQVNMQAKRDQWNREASYSLGCFEVFGTCESLIARAEANPGLKAALLQARQVGVDIHPEAIGWFHIDQYGNVHVPTWFVSDERIITFLTN